MTTPILDTSVVDHNIQLVNDYRPSDPTKPLEEAVHALAGTLALPALADSIARKVVTALLSASAIAQGALWEASVPPVVDHALRNDSVQWVTRAFVAKKIVSVLRGQNAWDGAETVKRRTHAVIAGLVDEALLPSASPQELRIVADALHELLTGSVSVRSIVVAVATACVAGENVVQKVLLPLLQRSTPPAAFLCAVEELCCASDFDVGLRERVLSLLPKQFEGKGSFAVKAAAEAMAESLTAACAGDQSDEALVAIEAKLAAFVEEGQSNMSAFRASIGKSLVSASCAFAKALLSPTMTPVSLKLLRLLTLVVVYSGLASDEARSLLEDELTKDQLQSLCVPLCESVSEDAVLDVDMCSAECRLLMAKKLWALASGPRDDEAKAAMAASCKTLCAAVEKVLKKTLHAEKTLKQQGAIRQPGGAKRARESVSEEKGDATQSSITMLELRQRTNVLHVVKHLCSYFASGADHKVAPSWLR